MYAIASAALVHSIARACSIGVTTKCSCGALPSSSPSKGFKWGGCGDDVHFGLFFAEVFTEAVLTSKKGKPKTSKRALTNKHNFRAGRQVRFRDLEGRKEMFYLTTHSTHFIYGYMASN